MHSSSPAHRSHQDTLLAELRGVLQQSAEALGPHRWPRPRSPSASAATRTSGRFWPTMTIARTWAAGGQDGGGGPVRPSTWARTPEHETPWLEAIHNRR